LRVGCSPALPLADAIDVGSDCGVRRPLELAGRQADQICTQAAVDQRKRGPENPVGASESPTQHLDWSFEFLATPRKRIVVDRDSHLRGYGPKEPERSNGLGEMPRLEKHPAKGVRAQPSLLRPESALALAEVREDSV